MLQKSGQHGCCDLSSGAGKRTAATKRLRQPAPTPGSHGRASADREAAGAAAVLDEKKKKKRPRRGSLYWFSKRFAVTVV
jgi:hypothetical protein